MININALHIVSYLVEKLHEKLFRPQNFSGMGQVSLVNGHLVRTPVLPAGFLQNVMHLPAGKTQALYKYLLALRVTHEVCWLMYMSCSGKRNVFGFQICCLCYINSIFGHFAMEWENIRKECY